MNILSPPESVYTDAYNQEKFRFVWRVYLFLFFVFAALTILHAVLGEPDVILTVSALLAMVLSLGVSAKTGKYTFAAIFGGIVGSVLNQLDLFFIINSQKFVNLLWIVSVALYVFYLLGSRIGFITLLLNLTGVTLSLFIIPKEVTIERIENLDSSELFSIVTNIVMITIFISYLMHQILKTSKYAEKQSKLAQEQLQQQYEIVQTQNEEKSVMLREIHHRVKNNLQIITSLLRLQSKEIEDKQTKSHFQEAINRVATMALIHEKMYGSKELSKINLKSYLESLAKDIKDSYSTEYPVNIKIGSEINHVKPKSLVSIALILNELITNSLKHAFVDKKEGEIEILIKKPVENKITIDYSDNGIWLQRNKKNSFGIELIDTFTEQLDGRYKFDNTNGTHYHFEFELDPKSTAELAEQ